MVAPGTAVGPLVPGISVVHIRMERQMSDATGVRGAAGGCRGPTTDRPGPVAADQTRYTFKVLNAARTQNIAMVGAAKAPLALAQLQCQQIGLRLRLRLRTRKRKEVVWCRDPLPSVYTWIWRIQACRRLYNLLTESSLL